MIDIDDVCEILSHKRTVVIRANHVPPELKCPFCANRVPDWHFEWHSRQDQSDIIAAKKLMECPVCRAGVAFDGFTTTRPEPDHVVAKRDIWQAARWARNQNNSLSDYLQTQEGRPYKSYWSNADIQSADNQAAKKPE